MPTDCAAGHASATQNRPYTVDTPAKEKVYARYFKPLASLENELFGLIIPEHEIVSASQVVLPPRKTRGLKPDI
jgi:hypothetical protein